MNRAFYKAFFLAFPMISMHMNGGAYSMNTEEDSKGNAKIQAQQGGKTIIVNKGFKPTVEPEIKQQKTTFISPPTGDLKYDEERKMYYYGKSISEVSPSERRVLEGESSNEIILMETKEN